MMNFSGECEAFNAEISAGKCRTQVDKFHINGFSFSSQGSTEGSERDKNKRAKI
jgi:hypothetical protein